MFFKSFAMFALLFTFTFLLESKASFCEQYFFTETSSIKENKPKKNISSYLESSIKELKAIEKLIRHLTEQLAELENQRKLQISKLSKLKQSPFSKLYFILGILNLENKNLNEIEFKISNIQMEIESQNSLRLIEQNYIQNQIDVIKNKINYSKKKWEIQGKLNDSRILPLSFKDDIKFIAGESSDKSFTIVDFDLANSRVLIKSKILMNQTLIEYFEILDTKNLNVLNYGFMSNDLTIYRHLFIDHFYPQFNTLNEFESAEKKSAKNKPENFHPLIKNLKIIKPHISFEIVSRILRTQKTHPIVFRQVEAVTRLLSRLHDFESTKIQSLIFQFGTKKKNGILRPSEKSLNFWISYWRSKITTNIDPYFQIHFDNLMKLSLLSDTQINDYQKWIQSEHSKLDFPNLLSHSLNEELGIANDTNLTLIDQIKYSQVIINLILQHFRGY